MSSSPKRKVCAVLVDRANYGRMKPVLRAAQAHDALDLQIVAAGTMVLERFGRPVDLVREDGFEVHGEAYVEVEGSTPVTMAKAVGLGIIEFASELQRLAPDVVLLIGDRYEMLSAAVAAAFMNLCIAHVQGGEVSASIDESTRHAITKLAHYHFPATARAREFLMRMGEPKSSILGVGCPSSDIARALDRSIRFEDLNGTGGGSPLDPAKPYLLVVFHPTTTRFGEEIAEVQALLEALSSLSMPTALLWPNIDAGSDHISKQIRIFRTRVQPEWLRTITNLPPETYLRALANAACAVGNSSSFVRDAGFFGTPVVLVGGRQDGREHDVHVSRAPVVSSEIRDAIARKLAHGRYPPSALYGDGFVSGRIANALATLELYVQKRLHYPETIGVEG